VHWYARGSWKVKMELGIDSIASCIRNMLQAHVSISIYTSPFLSVQLQETIVFIKEMSQNSENQVCNKLLKVYEVTSSSKPTQELI
jgi:folylpolyglutamate synthase/dihydropteroate synthase